MPPNAHRSALTDVQVQGPAVAAETCVVKASSIAEAKEPNLIGDVILDSVLLLLLVSARVLQSGLP